MKLFQVYRVLAFIVGVLLAFCALVAAPLKYLAAEGSDLQQFGESASIMWLFHGWIFMAYVVVAFLLARRAQWSVGFTVLMLVAGLVPLLIFWVERKVAQKVLAGLVPLLIFWVERKVAQKVRAENPELVAPSTA